MGGSWDGTATSHHHPHPSCRLRGRSRQEYSSHRTPHTHTPLTPATPPTRLDPYRCGGRLWDRRRPASRFPVWQSRARSSPRRAAVGRAMSVGTLPRQNGAENGSGVLCCAGRAQGWGRVGVGWGVGGGGNGQETAHLILRSHALWGCQYDPGGRVAHLTPVRGRELVGGLLLVDGHAPRRSATARFLWKTDTEGSVAEKKNADSSRPQRGGTSASDTICFPLVPPVRPPVAAAAHVWTLGSDAGAGWAPPPTGLGGRCRPDRARDWVMARTNHPARRRCWGPCPRVSGWPSRRDHHARTSTPRGLHSIRLALAVGWQRRGVRVALLCVLRWDGAGGWSAGGGLGECGDRPAVGLTPARWGRRYPALPAFSPPPPGPVTCRFPLSRRRSAPRRTGQGRAGSPRDGGCAPMSRPPCRPPLPHNGRGRPRD